ncbi:MAG: ImmA/IrrE family metallo-endopeptidase [Nitrosomonas sp.]|jgi:Zn-dependent peptidase ImmA (M78 family)|uniref:ImmA/IrrE family metallo-endopeptidase n=1 Tax=Nitrosomonas sp. TaxID=42353 RepID=UPI002AB87BA0|nr:ImmA/IrrE family metallo-endopeptidase [Nitrosomonas sp.]MDZ4105038.1 ImmA/IrrE family metallo-endopeptidase [Nitrosomonas sp.]
MASSLTVPVNPDLLIWARETAGYDFDLACEKLKCKPEKLQKLEAGEAEPTYPFLNELADLYKRPLAIFFASKPPVKRNKPSDFRLQLDATSHGISPQLNIAIRKAWLMRENFLELSSYGDQPISPFALTATMAEDPEELGPKLRKLFGVSIATQLGWRAEKSGYDEWKKAIENQNVLVLELSRIPLSEMRGIALWEDTLPIIIVNGADSQSARVFTLIHEFAHLLLRQAALCDLAPAEYDSGTAKLEAFCNAVSAATIVPKKELVELVSGRYSERWTMEELAELAKTFSVSKEVILRRLLTVGLTSENYYRLMRIEFIAEYKRLRDKIKDKDGGPSPALMTVRNLGKPFVELVLNSYHDNRIGLSTVSDYLGVRVKHLPKIEALVTR